MAKVFTSDSDKKYQNFYKLYKKAHPGKNGNAVTNEANEATVYSITLICQELPSCKNMQQLSIP